MGRQVFLSALPSAQLRSGVPCGKLAAPGMTVLISGASGLIGSALVPFLASRGHKVIPLSRGGSQVGVAAPTWDPSADKIDLGPAPGLDAVLHLAGENIAGRWTARKKARIRDSRVRGTLLLSKALAALPQPPRVLICASGAGYYGHRGNETLDEHSAPGSSFLSQLCREWEQATLPASEKGIRVVNLRLGLVLAPKGGALGKMLPVFRMGLGGQLGHGQQYWSWIAMDDVLTVVERALTDERLSGPVNAVSPNPVTNREFAQTLASVLRRPALFATPAFVVRMLFGEMGDAALLTSARVMPALLEGVGFAFRFPKLEPALRHVLMGSPTFS